MVWIKFTSGELDCLKRLATGTDTLGDATTLRHRLLAAEKDAPTGLERVLINGVCERHNEPGVLEVDRSPVISRTPDGIWVMAWIRASKDGRAELPCAVTGCNEPESQNAHWRGLCENCSRSAGYHAVRLKFRPQAWRRDWAVPVDPEGDLEWDVPRTLFLESFPDEQTWHSNHDERDEMRHLGSSPQWIRDWHGPFEVEIADSCRPWGTELTA